MFISLTTIDDVKQFVELANACSHDVLVASGNYRVNAKSIMGVFSLDLDKPVELIIEGSTDAEDVKTFFEAISGFIETRD